MSEPLINVRLTNYYKVRAALEQFGPTYRGIFRDTVQAMLYEFRNFAQMITHITTGTLARSHNVYYDRNAISGYVYPESIAKPPDIRGGRLYPMASQYAVWEHARGGTHAFYERTLNEFGPSTAMDGIRVFLGRMPGGIVQ